MMINDLLPSSQSFGYLKLQSVTRLQLTSSCEPCSKALQTHIVDFMVGGNVQVLHAM